MVERKRQKQQEYHAGSSILWSLLVIVYFLLLLALDRDTKQRNSLQTNHEHEKLPSLYPPPVKGDNQMRKFSLHSIHPSAPGQGGRGIGGSSALGSQQSHQYSHPSDSKINSLFDKVDQIILHLSNNDQRLSQLEEQYFSKNPVAVLPSHGKVQSHPSFSSFSLYRTHLFSCIRVDGSTERRSSSRESKN